MKGGGVWVGGCGVGGDEAEREEEVDGLQSDHDSKIQQNFSKIHIENSTKTKSKRL